MSKPSYNKDLPGLPSAQRPSRGMVFSQNTYTKLLEQEVEQIRLVNDELRLLCDGLEREMNALQAKYNIEMDRRRRSEEEAFQYKKKIQYRDKIVSDIASTMVNQFHRYKDVEGTEKEMIKVYSSFDDSDGSPI
jgi:hypothetical protein